MRKSLPLLALALLLLVTTPVGASNSATSSETPVVAGVENPTPLVTDSAAEVGLDALFAESVAEEKTETAYCPGGTAPSCPSVNGTSCPSTATSMLCYDYTSCEWFYCFCEDNRWNCWY